MIILVTGSQGQVGSEIVRLASDGFEVHAFDRQALDITDRAAINRRLDEVEPDIVVNCAAYTAVDRAEDEADLALAVNAHGVRLLGDSCRERGVGVLHLSTDYVFDGCKRDPYLEDDPANPLGVYGASKLAGEELLRAANHRHIILRVSWVFGRLGRSFVDTILRLAQEREVLSVVDDQVGAPSPAPAIARAVRTIAQTAVRSQTDWGTYHFTSTPALSWCAFAREIVSVGTACGVLPSAPRVTPISSDDWPSKVERPRNSRLDGSKTAAAFAYAPESWRTHLQDYVQSLKPPVRGALP